MTSVAHTFVFAGVGQLPTELHTNTGLAAFEFTNAPDALPNYVPGAKWGTQAEPIHTMQLPLTSEESMKHLALLPGFHASLFASEPDIAKPICMAWDDRGRLWIAETVDYPNNMQPPGQGHDRIKICEDTHLDGKADKFTIFADKLSVPTGMVFARNGLIMVHSGRTEFLQDTNGDGRADVREVLFSGWGTKDTHAGPSNLRYGFDNWIWGTVGYSGFDGEVGGKHLRFGQGIYRFKPDGSALEFVRSTDNNTWGLGISEDNVIFGSTANGNASVYVAIPNRYYEAVSGWSAARLETIADSQSFFPITSKVRQVDWHGRYTAGAGSAIYTARQFPREYWNRAQFVAEPTGHLLGQFELESHGADFMAHNRKSFLASDDEWTSPVCAEVGPDGALWVIDWYSYVVQHNPTPHGFQTGKGNAYETSLRDKTHGRIYRITYESAKPQKRMKLTQASPRQLVQAFRSENLFWRMTAQRLLVERGKSDVVPDLCRLISDKHVDEIGLNPGAIHALWTLRALNVISQTEVVDAVTSALKHPSAAVRKAAIEVMPRNSSMTKTILRGALADDPDPQVRLALFLALSDMPDCPEFGLLAFREICADRNYRDKWISEALTAAAAKNSFSFLSNALGEFHRFAGVSDPTNVPQANIGRIIRIVAQHQGSQNPEKVVDLLISATHGSSQIRAAAIDGFAAGWPDGKTPQINDAQKGAISDLLRSLPEQGRSALLILARKWRRESVFGEAVTELAQSLKATVADEQTPPEKRVNSARELGHVQDTRANVEFILAQITPLTLPDFSAGLISAVAESKEPETGRTLLTRWPQLGPSSRPLAISTLLRRAEWSAALLDAIEKGQLRSSDIALEHWSQLKLSPDRKIAARAATLSKAGGVVSSDRAEIVKRLLPLAKETGDPKHGSEVFKANCAVCHSIDGNGGKVGPDLTGIGARDPSEILIDILDPNRSVEANYRLWTLATKDGETWSGRLETETQTSVEILDTTGAKHVFQRKEMDSMRCNEISIMPNGFESIPPGDLKSLLAFLTQPRTSVK